MTASAHVRIALNSEGIVSSSATNKRIKDRDNQQYNPQ